MFTSVLAKRAGNTNVISVCHGFLLADCIIWLIVSPVLVFVPWVVCVLSDQLDASE